jgi:hypothetical protein
MKRRGSIAVDLGFVLFGAYLIIFDDDSARRHGTLARMIVGRWLVWQLAS